jgi:hypothetical protein
MPMDNPQESSPTLYSYSGPQRKMLRLYYLLRDSLRFEKYYAFKLKRWQFWNSISDCVIAIAAAGSLGTAKFMGGPLGKQILTDTLIFSTFATVLKPVIKPTHRISRLSKLQSQYLELYQSLDTLKCEIQETDQIQQKHERQLTALHDKFNKLGLLNEPAENPKLMARFQEEVELQIPSVSLWLPQDATERPDTSADAPSASS